MQQRYYQGTDLGTERRSIAPPPESRVDIDAATLPDTLAAELSERARLRTRVVVRGVGLSILATTAVALLAAWLPLSDPLLAFLARPGVLLAVIAAISGGPALAMVGEFRGRRGIRHATEAVARSGDLHHLPALVDALTLDDPRSRLAATDALIGMLPLVRASESELFGSRHHARLIGILAMRVENPLFKEARAIWRPAASRAVDVRVAILKAFEQIGDPRALHVVRRLAQARAKTLGEKRIRQAAEECLPYLEAIAARERNAQRLLRPSDSGKGDELLLHPSCPSSAGDTEMLLRVAEGAG